MPSLQRWPDLALEDDVAGVAAAVRLRLPGRGLGGGRGGGGEAEVQQGGGLEPGGGHARGGEGIWGSRTLANNWDVIWPRRH